MKERTKSPSFPSSSSWKLPGHAIGYKELRKLMIYSTVLTVVIYGELTKENVGQCRANWETIGLSVTARNLLETICMCLCHTLHCIELHCIALLTLHYTTLHYNTLHYITIYIYHVISPRVGWCSSSKTFTNPWSMGPQKLLNDSTLCPDPGKKKHIGLQIGSWYTLL